MCEVKHYNKNINNIDYNVSSYIADNKFKLKLSIQTGKESGLLEYETKWLMNGSLMDVEIPSLLTDGHMYILIGQAVADYYHHITVYQYNIERYITNKLYHPWISICDNINGVYANYWGINRYHEYHLTLQDTFVFRIKEMAYDLTNLNQEQYSCLTIKTDDDWLCKMKIRILSKDQPISDCYAWAITKIIAFSHPLLLAELSCIILNRDLCKLIVLYVIS